ncbi:hypothetical protein KAR91_18030 [Candidatus Pacearchaeota archaeon]|nr:hypothetical protein [Candidatus Pacearchaeota archaeon]
MFEKIKIDIPEGSRNTGITAFMRTLEVGDKFECDTANVYMFAKQIGIKVRRRTVDGRVIVERIR